MGNIRGVSSLQVLVETVALRDELLLPLSESLFLDLDLLGKALAQAFFFLLELGVVQLAWSCLSKLPCFHLLGAIGFVVRLLGGVDEIKHVGADEDGAELLKIAMVLVLDLGDTPGILTALDDLALVVLHVLLRANNREWHGGHQAAGVGSGVLVVLLYWWLIDLDALGGDDSTNL